MANMILYNILSLNVKKVLKSFETEENLKQYHTGILNITPKKLLNLCCLYSLKIECFLQWQKS
ncbi:hypothetical protein BpHYR1_001816 [Brachionus plicatilis]|uniref:Uncharacterized protein n=1 Tax=Brachionus plicatilis TaxID=10195 RepID=A0A3M7PRX5_BRAPC|nr:hypothetical protein BpHYR1_001816 [Brachionus plicatilis]